jgi:hypothetical protein
MASLYPSRKLLSQKDWLSNMMCTNIYSNRLADLPVDNSRISPEIAHRFWAATVTSQPALLTLSADFNNIDSISL